MSTVIRTTPVILELTHKSVFAPLGCAALCVMALYSAVFGTEGFVSTVMALLGSVMCAFGAVVFFENSILRLDLEAGTVSFKHNRALTVKSVELPLSALRAIRVESSYAGNGISYRTCLVTADQSIPLTVAFASGEKSGPAVHRWLEEQGIQLAFEEKEFDAMASPGT